eukprot:Anaeramoba_ignava/a89897_161.p1 GENE.a89897_161~~a89897_161.p1  ORF type:complete len:294 (+),score=85.24 a89897_161:161-1042(+)
MKLTQVIVLGFLFCFVFSWWDNSHMIIIEIASRNLTTSQKNTLLDILSTWEPDFPGDLYAAAIWPDQIKQPPIKIDSMAGWHFADLVYNPDNIKVNYTLPPGNVIAECQQALDTLEDNSCTSVWAWAFQLRQLFHFVGDIHQPLHCIDRFTKQFPDGDRGGNEFKLKGDASYDSSLHFFWDAAGGEYVTNYPLTQNQIAQLVANATEIMKKYPVSYFKGRFSPTDFDFNRWANESYSAAVKYAYTDIEPNTTPSSSYASRCFEISQEQIAIAGYRLGACILRVINNQPKVNWD